MGLLAVWWMCVVGSGMAAEPDLDGDGWTAADDCDDTEPAVNPDAAEICNGLDDDCDSLVDDNDDSVSGRRRYFTDADGDGLGVWPAVWSCSQSPGIAQHLGDCDDMNSTIRGPTLFHTDADADGYGSPSTSAYLCTRDPPGFVRNSGDCNDRDATIHPRAPEVCNDVDDNCDGLVDEADPRLIGITFYADDDRDGYGDDLETDSTACEPPYGFVELGGDCDSANLATHPGAPELCDGEDNDCDGEVDEFAVKVEWYLDVDGDGYGVSDDTVRACGPPPGYARGRDDCDDEDAAIAPDVDEVCGNGIDDDCDGAADNCAMLADDVADFIATGPDNYALLGSSLASGDINGDGTGDLFVSAPGTVTNGAFAFFGPLAGVSTVDAADVVVTDIQHKLGGAIALGDADQDGSMDLLLGAPWADEAYLIRGPVTGLVDVSDADATFDVPRGHAIAGSSALIVPDHTGDGIPDVLMGGTGWDISPGAVFVFSGALTGTCELGSDSTNTYLSTDGADHTGQSLASLGDENGDGLEDILIGSSGRGGTVYMVEGGETRGRHYFPDVAAAVLHGPGYGIAGGDLNGDGYRDAVIGGPYSDVTTGMVYAFLGPLSGELGVRDATARWEEGSTGAYGFGGSVATGEDIDGDGSSDLLIGEPHTNASGGGAVYLDFGPATGVVDHEHLTSWLSSDADWFGGAVTFVPDSSGDGLPEIAVGAPLATNGASPYNGKVVVFLSDSLFE